MLCLAVRSTVVLPRSVATLDLQRRENLLGIDQHPEDDTPIVAVPLLDLEGEATPQKLARIGTLCRVLDRTKMPDGSQRVVLQGMRRVVLRSIDDSRGWFEVETSEPTYAHTSDADLGPGVERAMAQVHELVRVDSRYSEELPRVLALNTSAAGHFADLAAAKLHLSYADRARMLVETDVLRRLDLLGQLLEQEIARGEVTASLHGKVEEEKRRSLLREQLRGIQMELGEADPMEALARELESKVASAEIPETARRACTRCPNGPARA